MPAQSTVSKEFTDQIQFADHYQIKQQLEHQILEIDRRITELMTLRGEINELLDDWTPTAKTTGGEICPILKKTEPLVIAKDTSRVNS